MEGPVQLSRSRRNKISGSFLQIHSLTKPKGTCRLRLIRELEETSMSVVKCANPNRVIEVGWKRG